MKILIPLAEGFEEIEFSTIIDILRRTKLEAISASISNEKVVTGMMGVSMVADTTLDEIITSDYACLILPGGNPAFKNLCNDSRISNLIQYFIKNDKYVGAICAGPVALDNASVLGGKRVTAYPGIKHLLSCEYTGEPVSVDGKLITAKGPNYAMDFAFKVASIFAEAKDIEQAKSDIFV